MTRRRVLHLGGLALLSGCGGGGGSNLPAEVAAFVAPQALPRTRRERLVSVVDGVDLFELEYTAAGSPTAAMGLRYRGRIGWLWVDEEGLPVLDRPHYRFNTEDAYLFTGDFLMHLKEVVRASAGTDPDFRFAYEFLRDTIARSPLADHDALLRIAYDLYTEPAYFLADTLLANPNVRTYRDVLTAISGLTDAGYASARDLARELLRTLP